MEIKTLARKDRDFPKGLIGVKPEVGDLYYKGDLGLLSEDKVRLAIVGSRKMTDYGRRVIEKMVPSLVGAGVVIVSGFMYGVDQMAHEVCLDCGGGTVAVLGWGIDRELSVEDQVLYEKFIQSNSLMVSEYQGKEMAKRHYFVQRNRLVVGLSEAVLVIEAAEKSGTMTSVNWAKKTGKSILCAPGQITSKVSEGTNWLIKTGQAEVVTGVEDVLDALGLKPGQMKLENIRGQSLTKERPLLRWLGEEPGGMEVDRLAKLTKRPVVEVLGELTRLEILGEVEQRGGKFFKKDI